MRKTKSVEKHDELWLLEQVMRMLSLLRSSEIKVIDHPMCDLELDARMVPGTIVGTAINTYRISSMINHVVKSVWKYNSSTLADVICLGFNNRKQSEYRQTGFSEKSIEINHEFSGEDALIKLCVHVFLAAIEDVLTAEYILRRGISRIRLGEMTSERRGVIIPYYPMPCMLKFVKNHRASRVSARTSTL